MSNAGGRSIGQKDSKLLPGKSLLENRCEHVSSVLLPSLALTSESRRKEPVLNNSDGSYMEL